MLHQVRQYDLCCAKRNEFVQEFVCYAIHELGLLLLDFAHFSCTVATLGNASELNKTLRRVLKSAKKAGLGDSSFQYVSQIHSPPMMCTGSSRKSRGGEGASTIEAIGSSRMRGVLCTRLLYGFRFSC
jgi:hypothetical protein